MGLHWLSKLFWQATSVRNFRTFTVIWVHSICFNDKSSLYAFNRGLVTYTQKRKCIHIWTKNMGRFYHGSGGFLMLCV